MTDLFSTPSKHVAEYIQFLRDLRRMVPASVRKNERYLQRIEEVLGKPLLEVKLASEVNVAVMKVAEGRKRAYNGGYMDDGGSMRFKLGQAVVPYLRWAHGENLIERNCYTKNPFRKPWRRPAAFLTDEEVAYLYTCDTLEVRDAVMIRFFIDTGLRISQVVNVKVEDINWKDRLVRVYISKTDKYHTVPFLEETCLELQCWLRKRGIDSPYLFANKWGGRLSTANVRKRFQRISKKVGFRVHPHKFRHTAGTWWVEHVGQIHAMQLLDHSDAGMTNHYTHLVGKKLSKYQERVRKAKPMIYPKKWPTEGTPLKRERRRTAPKIVPRRRLTPALR